MLRLVSMFINGSCFFNSSFFKSAVTIYLLTLIEFLKNGNNEVQAIRNYLKYKRTPVTLHSTLNKYRTVRCNSVTDHTFL